jgi:hypothetical protein
MAAATQYRRSRNEGAGLATNRRCHLGPRSGAAERRESATMTIRPLLAVSALVALVAVEIVVTYARMPPSELYHVSGTGAAAGFGRALVYLNFPVALAALPLIVIALDRLAASGLVWAASLVAVALCAVVVWPGVVDDSDLDAKPVNALPAAGVAIALVLTVAEGPVRVRVRAYPAAAALAAFLVLFSLPWIAADLGFHLDGVPVLGTIWQTGALRHQPKVPGLHPAVHLGHHHGMDGTLLALAGIALVPLVRRMHTPALRAVVGTFVGLELAYGLANAFQDAWLEQVVKRDWTDFELPLVLHPAASFAWLGIVVAASAFATLILRPFLRRPARAGRRRAERAMVGYWPESHG